MIIIITLVLEAYRSVFCGSLDIAKVACKLN